jgi:hypothetical protein
MYQGCQNFYISSLAKVPPCPECDDKPEISDVVGVFTLFGATIKQAENFIG